MQKQKYTKREFLKLGITGAGGLMCMPAAVAGIGGRNSKPDELWKWSKEAMFQTETPRGVRCMICPNECTPKPGELSDCHNRINKDGKLYTIAYGNPCAVHVDPVEKKPLFHFKPGTHAFSIATAGCNLACLNCQNWTISQTTPTKTQNFDLMPDKVVKQAVHYSCESVAYTYSEPVTFYEYTLDTAKLVRSAGLKNILVSAGYIHEDPLRKLCKVIDAANIDLKSFKESIYLKLNAGKLQPVLDALKIFHEEGVWLEITNLIIPGWNDDFDMIKEMCDWLYDNDLYRYPLFFSRFMPLYKLTQLPPTPAATLEKAREIALASGIQFVYIGNVPGTKATNTYCPKCHKLLMERRGYSILQNHIKNGHCAYCNEPISGVWE
ncbi:MAG: AmmeMemoRadiSam system radical SAM enzyme [Chlorobi bacterium]|nr:AmmeMemoRadiSam system radical SAM enzyme [Chlorobiota bacterium]